MATLPVYSNAISFFDLAQAFGGTTSTISLGDYHANYALIDLSKFDSKMAAYAPSASHLYNIDFSASLIFYPEGIYESKTAGPAASGITYGTTSTGNWSPLGNVNDYYTGTIVINAGFSGVYPGSGSVGGNGSQSTAKYAGVLLTGGGGYGGQNGQYGSNYGSGGAASYTLDSGVVLANPAGVQTVAGGNGGQDTPSYGGAGGGAPNGAVGASPNFSATSAGGAGGVAVDWNGIRVGPLTTLGINGSFGLGGGGATRGSGPGSAGGLGGGGGGTANVSVSTPASGGYGIVIVQYTVDGTTSTFYVSGGSKSFTLPPKCSNLKIWVCGGGGGAGPSAVGYAGGAGGGGGMAYYEWLPVSPTTTGMDASIYSIKWDVASVTNNVVLQQNGTSTVYSSSGGWVSMASTQTIAVKILTPNSPINAVTTTVYYNIYIAETANTATILAVARNVALSVASS